MDRYTWEIFDGEEEIYREAREIMESAGGSVLDEMEPLNL